MIKVINTDQALDMIQKDEGAVVFDVRRPGEYRESKIDGSINSNVLVEEEFTEYLEDLDKDATYIVLCRTYNRSKRAAEIMEKAGFKNIYRIIGGMEQWVKENKPHV